jgi:ketosteroid isomerase-like protein
MRLDALRMLPQMFKTYEFHDLRTFAGEDPEVAFVFTRSSCTLANDAPYEQDYVFFARVRDGAIIEYREYIDSVRAVAAIRAIGA